jgi:hypothetical protein
MPPAEDGLGCPSEYQSDIILAEGCQQRCRLVATRTTEAVRGGVTLQRAFVDPVGPRANDEEVLTWLGYLSS